MSSYEYDRVHFAPPAPVAHVKLIHPQTGRIATDVPMLLDSGADQTVLPAAVVAALGVAVTGETATRTFDGRISMSAVACLNLKLGKVTYSGQYILAECDVGFLGRDILNSVVLELHGPEHAWSIRRR